MDKPKIYDYYVLVYEPDHPRSYVNNGYVPEHILIAEKELGRFLSPDEIVRHKNGDTNDNEPANLEIISTSQGYRKSVHLGEEQAEARKVSPSTTFIGCKFQKPCWKNVRAPIAKQYKVYVPYICSYQEMGDIYDCSRYWGYLMEEIENKENEDIDRVQTDRTIGADI